MRELWSGAEEKQIYSGVQMSHWRKKGDKEEKANDVEIKRESGGSRQTGQAFYTSLMR